MKLPSDNIHRLSDVSLLIPENDQEDPIITVLVPALNEQLTIEEFVEWCHEGISKSGLSGEVLIVDSSTDETPALALAAGARVLKTPKRGLGRAYIDAIPFVRGKYVVMGDADLTYDFRELNLFTNKLEEGFEFAMGSRWLGSIEKGAMPGLHQYFGTPFTTWILNRIYGSSYSDIHCGMRALLTPALTEMNLSSQSWEYASEMVLKSVKMELLTTEVPVTFFKDRDGRESHHKRSGWFSPFHAAWINLRAMFAYKAEFFLLKPGLVLFIVGLLLTLPLSFGAVSIRSFTFSLYWMLLGVMFAVVGMSAFYSGVLTQILSSYDDRPKIKWTNIFRYTRSVVISFLFVVVGVSLEIPILVFYLSHSLTLPDPLSIVDHLAINGILFIVIGFLTFGFVLVLDSASISFGSSSSENVRT